MDRLTERSEMFNDAHPKKCVLYGVSDCYLHTSNPQVCKRCTELVTRLAAYEDTGLTPEECAELAAAKDEGRVVPDCAKCALRGFGDCILSNCIGKATREEYDDEFIPGIDDYVRGKGRCLIKSASTLIGK